MTTGNLGEPAESTTVETKQRTGLPADYYSTPPSESKRLPKWATYGCGGAALLFVLLLFGGALLLTGPRVAGAIDFVIGMTLGEMRGMYAAEVTQPEKDRLESDIEAMREGLRAGRVPTPEVQPFLKTVQEAIADKSVTRSEVQQISQAARRAATRR